jgi:hypothetical protein
LLGPSLIVVDGEIDSFRDGEGGGVALRLIQKAAHLPHLVLKIPGR